MRGPRIPGVLAALLLVAAPAIAQAEEPVPGLDDPKGSTLEVQILGWSADERRYALRVYEQTELFGDETPPPACKGYVDHTGKKFLGGLSFVLYEGGRRIGGWRIQDAKQCTPPETARERLAEAKAALAQQGIDLTALGATLADANPRAPTTRTRGKKTEYRLTTSLALPHGPWAGKKLQADCVVEVVQFIPKGSEDEGLEASRGRATLKLSLGAGKGAVPLSELKLGPSESDPGMSWVWSAGFDRALLSPSGKVLVALAYVHHGEVRLNNKPRLLLAPVELAGKLGAAAPVSAPTP